MIQGQKRDKLGRFAYGRAVFGSSGSPRPGKAIPPPGDWTHVYATEGRGFVDRQGKPCKILSDYRVGLVRIEFEDGLLAVVRKDSIKPLPDRPIGQRDPSKLEKMTDTGRSAGRASVASD